MNCVTRTFTAHGDGHHVNRAKKRLIAATVGSAIALAVCGQAQATGHEEPPSITTAVSADQPPVVATGTGKPVAAKTTPRKAKAIAKNKRRLATTIVMDPTSYSYIGCSSWYVAGWGGWEMVCHWEKLYWSEYNGDYLEYYYWDAGSACGRVWKTWTRHLKTAVWIEQILPLDQRVCAR